MKLLRAEFENFRMLRDLKLDFANGSDRKLTVIRAANESGKTTILHALQWALYGDSALPGKGVDFRLFPIDWQIEAGKRVPITATIEFEITSVRRGANGLRQTRRRFRLIRSAYEDVDSTVRRSPSNITLFALTDSGADPIDSPEAFINDELPPELRDVFFTDGDRALSFIEAEVATSTKRERVHRAIRSLLGLGVLDDAIRHVRKSATEVNKQAKGIGADGKLDQVASRITEIAEDEEKLGDDLEDAKQQFEAFDEKVGETNRQIAESLKKGDKEELERSLSGAKSEIKKLDGQLTLANKEHSALFRSRSLASDLMAPVNDRAFAILEELRDQHKIPNTTIPVLEDRLSQEICICGETLSHDSVDDHQRRDHIQMLIDDSRHADEIQEIITELYYGSRSLRPGETGDRWVDHFAEVVRRREAIEDLRSGAGRKLRALELQLDSLPDTDIKGLRETLRGYQNQRDRLLTTRATIETKLDTLQRDRTNLTADRDRLLREQTKGTRILSELQVTQDVIQVLQNSYEWITNEELTKVSDLMNKNFLEMIGADPEQGAIIKSAEISSDFDIIVYGPNERTLNPDRDLNGASRRALTLAFILALTAVSEVEAPNVIDTPLGMTSGYVKRSILKTAIRESAQLILFLTPDEIAGCEDIIDEEAGVIFTLTNPAHYPKMLVNDPMVAERKVIRCECSHRTECEICQRHTDVQILTAVESVIGD